MCKIARRNQLAPKGKPKYVRVYDNGGESIDRYTVVFTGRYGHLTAGETWILAMNSAPFHPQGFGQHDFTVGRPDFPKYSHIGKKITFDMLPLDCQRAAMNDYLELWSICEEV